MLTMLPCGGLGELDERGETMRIDCRLHREWLRDQATGAVLVAYVKGTMEYLYRDHPSCGAVTVLAPGTGIRIVLGGPETRREDMAHLPHAEGSAA